jgi:hypothetical protein
MVIWLTLQLRKRKAEGTTDNADDADGQGSDGDLPAYPGKTV